MLLETLPTDSTLHAVREDRKAYKLQCPMTVMIPQTALWDSHAVQRHVQRTREEVAILVQSQDGVCHIGLPYDAHVFADELPLAECRPSKEDEVALAHLQ